MSNKFDYSGDCPCCNQPRRKNECRRSLSTGMEFCREATNPIGYIDRGQDRYGFTMWVKSEDAEAYSEKSREDRERDEKQRQEAKAKAKEEAIKAELPLSERHTYHLAILDQLTLSNAHRQLLRNRGLSDDRIDAIGYRSVNGGQRLKGKFPPNLPGYDIQTNSLCNSAGILCPIWQDGKIASFKIRLDKPRGKQRYSSVSGGGVEGREYVKSFHIYGEPPLAVLPGNKGEIWVAEGVEIKPLIVNQVFGKTVLGGGRYWHESPNHSAKYLTKFKELYGNKIILCPDAGDILNEIVYPKWIEEYQYFESQGFDVKFAWWGQTTKEHDDIDELADFSSIQYLSFEELKKITGAIGTPSQDSIAGSVEIFTPQVTNEPENSNSNLADLDQQRWLNSRKFTPQITINSTDFHFPRGYQTPVKNAIISVKSGMGTGKTKALLEVIKSSSNRAFLLGCLNNLLLQTISRGMSTGIKIYHLHDDDALEMNLVKDENTHLACCIDSMHHLDGHFRGVDLYIDEVDSVIKHIISGGTLGEKQAYTMKVFEKAILECNRVFILDANNSDLLTDFIATLAPSKQVVKIENTAKPQKQHYKFVNGYDPEKDAIKQRDKSPLIKMMCESGVNPFIASDSRDFTNAIVELLHQENKEGLALNRDTVNDDWAKLFLNNPDSFLEAKQLDFFAISPTANSGVSITNTAKFNHKFSIFVGVLTTNQQTQIMMRLRPYLEHYVYCPKFSTIRNGEKAKTPANYRDNIIQKIILSANLADDKSTQSMAEIIADKIAKAKDDPWFELSCQLGALDNYERENLRKCLMYALQEQGHTVEEIDLEISKEHNQKYADAKDAVLTNYATEVLEAEAFPDIQEANRIAKSNPKKEVMRRVEKTRLLDRLPGIDNTEVWGVDFVKSTLKDKEFITKHQRFWMLNNTEISRKRSEVNWFYKATEGQFYLGSMAKDAHLKIWALQQLNVLQFLDGQEYHKDSIEVMNFYNQARENRDIKLALGVELPKPTVRGNERIKFLKDCLLSIGVPFKSTGRKMINGTRKYYYSIDIEAFNSTERLEIINAIDRKFSGYLLSESVKKVDWENQVTSEGALNDMQQQTQLTTLEDIDWVEVSVSNIRLALECNSWEMVSNVFADMQNRGVSKIEVWQQLTLQEQSQIKQLQPETTEGKWAKYLLDTEKSNNQDQLNNAMVQFNQFFLSVATPDQVASLCECLPRKLVEKLTA